MMYSKRLIILLLPLFLSECEWPFNTQPTLEGPIFEISTELSDRHFIDSAFVTLTWTGVGFDNFTALETVIDIAPVVLLLAGIFGASFAYYKGYQGAQAQDASGIMRMVLGVILIILFVTLFGTIMTAMQALAVAVNDSGYTALTTVVAIAPVVLFLGGIFAGTATGVSGAKAFRRRRRAV